MSERGKRMEEGDVAMSNIKEAENGHQSTQQGGRRKMFFRGGGQVQVQTLKKRFNWPIRIPVHLLSPPSMLEPSLIPSRERCLLSVRDYLRIDPSSAFSLLFWQTGWSPWCVRQYSLSWKDQLSRLTKKPYEFMQQANLYYFLFHFIISGAQGSKRPVKERCWRFEGQFHRPS